MVELTGDDLNFFSAFERITGVIPIDFISTEFGMYYLVSKPDLGKAIGKNGANIQRLRDSLRRKVVVIGDNSDIEDFMRGFFSNVEIISVELREAPGQKVLFLTIAEKDRGIAIGKSGERIKAAKEFMKKKFNAEIKLQTRRTEI
ncbi:MAG: NusA-like transcription termination signal-binding factor [Candidatus Micrarchaeota archaeon]